MVDKIVQILASQTGQRHQIPSPPAHCGTSGEAGLNVAGNKCPRLRVICMNTTEKKKILVVDDDAVILKAFSIKLERSGYEVLTAADGSAAVNIVRTRKPDAIILDINFPPDFGSVAWDGFRIMEWLKRMDEAQKTPIFIITGSDPEKYMMRARELGAVAFFHKPVIHEHLVDALRKLLGEERPVATS
jgi:CheY-like chemotaxis protein